MDLPASERGADSCRGVGEILSTIGDKWTVQVIVSLRDGPWRFSQIKRHLPGISQQMLTRVLRFLERDGMVRRTVHPTTPPQVEYALTDLGYSLSEAVHRLAIWVAEHRDIIRDSRSRYEAERR